MLNSEGHEEEVAHVDVGFARDKVNTINLSKYSDLMI
jgi:hypothetical protein